MIYGDIRRDYGERSVKERHPAVNSDNLINAEWQENGAR